MARSKEAQERYNAVRQVARKKKLAAKRAKAARKAASKPPVITEADLLYFQLAHFGDATCPENWFVDAQLALEYEAALDPDLWEEEDDGLGWYEDGVKRTLTEAQVEMFRHSEMEEIARAERLAREEMEQEREQKGVRAKEEQEMEREFAGGRGKEKAMSPLSDASSMDEDLIGLATNTAPTKHAHTNSPSPATPTLPVPSFTSTKRSHSTSTKHSGTSTSTTTSKPAHPKKKHRKEEVPYEQRNKRKWEEHIATVDPVKGTWMYESKTANRLRRELDDVRDEGGGVEMDY